MNLKELNFLNPKTRRKIAAGALSIAMGFFIVAPNISAVANITGIQVSTIKAFADEVTQQEIKKVVSYGSSKYFLMEDGSVYVKGDNEWGQLGTGDTLNKTDYTKINLSNVNDVITSRSTNGSSAYFLMKDGSVYAVGDNSKGQLGVGDTSNMSIPVKIDLSNVKNVITSGLSAYFLMEDGSAYVVGDNSKGQLGVGDTSNKSTPIKVDLSNVKNVIASSFSAYFLMEDGSAYAVGDNKNGQLGIGSTSNKSTPIKVNLSNIKDISLNDNGDYSSVFFLLKDGSVYATGYNVMSAYISFSNKNYGQVSMLGTGDTTSRSTPVKLDLGTKIAKKVIVEGSIRFILMEDGSVYAFGINMGYLNTIYYWAGRLGTGDEYSRGTPTELSIGSVKDVVTDGASTYFILEDGSVWSCGLNDEKQLGIDDDSNYKLSPVKIDLDNVEQVITTEDGVFFQSSNGLYVSGKYLNYPNTPAHLSPSSIIYGAEYTIDKIYNADDQSKYGSWFTGFYSKSLYDNNDLMQFILNNTSGTATLSNGGVIQDESQIKNKYFLSDGSMILVDNYGMVQYYKDLTTTSPATLPIDGSGITGADTLVFGTGTSAVKHPVLYFGSSSKYIDTDGSLNTFTLKSTDVKKMFAYKYAKGVSQYMLIEKTDGSLVYLDSTGSQQDFGLNMNDVSYIIPATGVNKDIFVMKDGTLRDDKGVIALPDGLTLKKVWSNRFFEMSDGFLYTFQNGTFKNTNTLVTLAKIAQNNALLLKNGNFQLADDSGNLTNDLDVSGNDVKYMSQLDSTNMYLILNDGTTYGVGDKVQGDSLENHGVNINDVSAFLSNGSDNVVRALVTKYGTVYTNPSSWTKNTLVHFSSDAVNSAHESNPVYTNPGDVVDDYNNSGDPDLVNKLPGGTDEKGQIEDDLNPTVTDTTAPILNITGSPTDWTNQDVTLNISASDEEGGSGFNKIVLPDNSEITTSDGTFKVTENGTYTFKAQDKAGNEATQTVTVSKIDKAAPTVPSISNDNGTVTITAGTDTDSGVKETDYSVDGGAYQKYTEPFTLEAGSHTIKAKTIDNAGNESTEASKDITVAAPDTTGPTINVAGNPDTWTNKDITLSVSASDENGGSGFSKIILPDNSEITTATGTFKVTQNGTYTFKAVDKAGNTTTKDIAVSKIDKTAPGAPTISNDSSTVTITGTDAESGVKEIDYSINGGSYQKYTEPFTLEAGNHTVKAKVTDNAGNTSTETSKDITVEDSNSDLQKATEAVENAENTKEQEDVDSARDLVDALPDSPEKQDLEDRLDAVQDEIDKAKEDEQKLKDATDAVDHAEDTHSQEDLDHAKDLVDDLPDGPAKDELEDRIKDIQDEIDQSSQEAQDLADAIAAVEKAEKTKTKGDYDTAVSKVSALKDSNDKTGLQGRLDKVKSDVDALIKAAGDAVTKAESTKTDEDINAAQGAIDKVPDGWDVSDLQNRLDNIKKEVGDQNLAAAKAAVEKAEGTQLQEDVDSARVLVNKIPSGQDKTDLSRRLDAVQDIINLYKNAEQRVEIAESLKTESAVSSARTVVSKLPEGDRKDSLNSRLDAVEAEITLNNTIEAIDKDITALEKDVDSHIKYNTTMDIESYKGKVTALRDRITELPDSVSDTKSAFNERLDSIDSKLTSQKAVQDAIEKVNDALDKAEQTLTDEDIQAAQDAIDDLPDSVDKSGYESRLDIIKQKKQAKVAKDTTDANKAVTKASRTRLQADIDAARALVDKLPDGSNKTQLSNQLDIIQRYVKK